MQTQEKTATLSILGLSATDGFITKDATTGDYTFTPNPDFNGEVTLNYVVSDGNGGNLLATNSFNIQAVNDKPVRTAGNVSTLFLIEDQPLASMGLAGLNYSVSGGTDESIKLSLTPSPSCPIPPRASCISPMAALPLLRNRLSLLTSSMDSHLPSR